MSFPRYEKTRESGFDWLGAVPSHWKLIPLKHLSDFVNGRAFKPEDWAEEGVPIIRIENLNGGIEFNFFAGDVERRYHVSYGDLLFGWSGNRGTSFGPFIWQRDGLYYLNQHIFKVVDLRCEKDWYFWCLRAVTAYVEQQAHGIIGMVHVTKGDLGAIRVSMPPCAEQLAIAAFLDRETAKIDALIAEQERLIALLKEKRQAVISYAVTKGLDPNAPMKDSGVEWLGEVPAHWEVRRLCNLCTKIGSGKTPRGGSEVYVDEGVLFIRSQNVYDEGLALNDVVYIDKETDEEMSSTRVLPGDVLINITGASIGRTCIVPLAACRA